MPTTDVFDSFEPAISSRGDGVNPWQGDVDRRRYVPDLGLLQTLLGIPIEAGSGSESGRFANAIDAWLANELRRAGFPPDEVWPRLDRPRVLPRELGMFVASLPARLRADVLPRLSTTPRVAPRDAKVLGRAFSKQVDVVIAQWSRGPELMISTKTMVSSFGNNLKNRFEEAYGDAKNLRGRFPLAAIGFLLVLRSTIVDKPDRYASALDMMRKLRAELDVYDTTAVVVAEWSGEPGNEQGGDAFQGVTLRHDLVPPDLAVDRFLKAMIESVLDRSPVEYHVTVRERHEHRPLPFEEGDDGADQADL